MYLISPSFVDTVNYIYIGLNSFETLIRTSNDEERGTFLFYGYINQQLREINQLRFLYWLQSGPENQ